jgi:uncharacterized protein YndB with AHSA1/START domain
VSRKIERTFTVSVAIEQVWRAMTDPAELNQWYFPFRIDDDLSTHTEIDGNDRAAEVLEFEPLRAFTLRTTMTGTEGWPHLPPGTRDMNVVFESTDSGTTVVITHSGFGDGADWEQALEATRRGVDETIADLVCYLETGVGVRRHPAFGDSWHGIGARATTAGLEVMSVQPDTFAANLGLTAGDLLIELAGAAVFGFHELNFFIREHHPGEQADAAWVHNGTLIRGTAALGPRASMTTFCEG